MQNKVALAQRWDEEPPSLDEIPSRLANERILFLKGPTHPVIINQLIAGLLWLEREDPEKDIHLYISSASPGDADMIVSAFALYDTMQLIRADVATYCIGEASGPAAMILAAGTHGKRYATPHSSISLGAAMGQAGGQTVDIEVEVEELLRRVGVWREVLSKHTGRDSETIRSLTERNIAMSPEQAVEYGIIDEILKVGHDGVASADGTRAAS